ncbi:glycosyl transferase [Lentzea sp. NBRC 105346]|uniref:glycosyltransferase family 2 protein n=1 Tax=Lentzea sp. NBRC 105346 TaxID=3032205 RepID=UPI0024A43FAB|nr:glycosyltransferase family 2 protein [Lentzea sp. NBRC 105346]GLZ28898.1 glycosyl transferase [Lentzea sp. NBRC 105346]
MTLVSICLPTRNGEHRVEKAVRTVLAQDHTDIELVISDNASTDGTEELCRSLAASDSRIVYHRHAENVGLLNNFIFAARHARGELFRWMGDDDTLEPHCVSRGVKEFLVDPRLLLVSSQVAYTGADGVTETAPYSGTGLSSDDPVVRLREMLRMLNESYLALDPLYSMMRREPVVALARRNMLKEDEVFACKLALAGPWGHIPEVLAHRHWKAEKMPIVARRLGVPVWQTRFANSLQLREILSWLPSAGLSPEQVRAARAAVLRMYLRRHGRTVGHRGRKLFRLVVPA